MRERSANSGARIMGRRMCKSWSGSSSWSSSISDSGRSFRLEPRRRQGWREEDDDDSAMGMLGESIFPNRQTRKYSRVPYLSLCIVQMLELGEI